MARMGPVTAKVIQQRLHARWPDKRMPHGAIKAIADDLGIPDHRVRTVMNAIGARVCRDLPTLHEAEAMRLRDEEGLSFSEVARRLGGNGVRLSYQSGHAKLAKSANLTTGPKS